VLVIASVGICVALLVLTPDKRNAKWVFTEVTDGSGWGSRGFSFLLGYTISIAFDDAMLTFGGFSLWPGQ
jgi:hypothetical protein